LIERLWKLLREEALPKWHAPFEDMQQAVAAVLDHRERYEDQLASLLTERFHLSPQVAPVVGGWARQPRQALAQRSQGSSCPGGRGADTKAHLVRSGEAATPAAVLGKTRCAPVYVLDQGQVVEQGTHRELLAQEGRYASLWLSQTGESGMAVRPQLARALPNSTHGNGKPLSDGVRNA
jgi:hypothetical protein